MRIDETTGFGVPDSKASDISPTPWVDYGIKL
jgi:hypothetical protein